MHAEEAPRDEQPVLIVTRSSYELPFWSPSIGPFGGSGTPGGTPVAAPVARTLPPAAISHVTSSSVPPPGDTLTSSGIVGPSTIDAREPTENLLRRPPCAPQLVGCIPR